MTPKKEDYLKIIFELGGKQKKVANKQLAMALGVAAGSVTEMVGKLVKEGLVAHTPYAGISLTAKGRMIAERLVRRHRLWEVFLTDKLGYDLSDVHDDAEVLEHVTSENLMDHLEKFLDYPDQCPHGGVIPPKDGGDYQEGSHTVLADIADGTMVTVERFIDNRDLLKYMGDIDLKLGERILVVDHAPFEGPITLKVVATGETTTVGFKAAHYVFVK